MFYLGDNIHDKDLKCGHKRPDQNLDHYNIDVDKIFKHKYEIIIKLERPDKVFSVKDNRQIGRWTMIYDEGFEFTIYDQVFFSFNRYKKTGRFSASNTDTEDTKGYINICNKTFLGWYHNKLSNANWGCFWGQKIENNKLKSLDVEKINYRNIFGLNKIPEASVENHLMNYSNNKSKNNDENDNQVTSNYNNNSDRNDDNDLSTLKNDFMKTSKMNRNSHNNINTISQSEKNKNTNKKNNNYLNKSNNSKKLELNNAKGNENSDEDNRDNNEQANSNNSITSFSYVDFLKSLRTESSKAKYSNIPHLDIYFLNNDSDNDSSDKNGGFLEVNSSTKLFQPDYNYVNKVNDPKNNYLWTAKIHDDFIGKSYSQMRNLLGNVNFIKSSFFDGEAEDNEKSHNANNFSHNENEAFAESNSNNYKKHLTEKERLVSTSKNEIKNFLEFATFLEFDINVETSSFLNTESKSNFLAKARDSFKSKSNTKNRESKSEFESEFESEEYEQNNKNTKINKNGKNKNTNKQNKNEMKKAFQESSDNEEAENEIDIELSEQNTQKEENSRNGKYGKLPLEFDWRNVDGTSYDSPVRKQGECGSCYAIAATSVLESRIRIKSNNRMKPLLSPSSILSCSRYNQGCFGGYPYLVGKFGKEFGFVEESCQPYTETDDKCFDFCFHEKKWKVKSYGYLNIFLR